MDRRSFLIGSSSLLTTAYLTKADWFLKNKKSVVPFPTNTKNSTKLFLVDRGMEYEWRLVLENISHVVIRIGVIRSDRKRLLARLHSIVQKPL